MKKEERRTIVTESVHNNVKQVFKTLDQEKACGGILCFWNVENEVNAANAICKAEGEDLLDSYIKILAPAAMHDKYYMKAMICAGFHAEIEYTKDEAKRKIIREKIMELAELFDE